MWLSLTRVFHQQRHHCQCQLPTHSSTGVRISIVLILVVPVGFPSVPVDWSSVPYPVTTMQMVKNSQQTRLNKPFLWKRVTRCIWFSCFTQVIAHGSIGPPAMTDISLARVSANSRIFAACLLASVSVSLCYQELNLKFESFHGFHSALVSFCVCFTEVARKEKEKANSGERSNELQRIKYVHRVHSISPLLSASRLFDYGLALLPL